MNTTIPLLSERMIRDRVGDTSFQRGLGYFHNEAITRPRRQGATLRALCWGTSDEPYRVSATFVNGAIADASCSCPIGHGGSCKHVAALLLTWKSRSGDFVEIEETDVGLERRTKPELIALIGQMLLRDPDLESLLELPLPKGHRTTPPADVEAFGRQAAAIFQRHPAGQWGVEGVIANELANLTHIGDSFANQDDIASAASVYEAVAVESIRAFEDYPYDEGEISGTVDECVESLDGLLEAAGNAPDDRIRVLAALVAIFQAQLADAPDYEIGARAIEVVIDQANPAERRIVADWLRPALAEEAADDEAAFRADVYDDVLFDLEKSTYDDERFLAESCSRGRIVDLVDRLLALGRVGEAVAATRENANGHLPELLDRFVERGHADQAERLAAERTSVTPDPTVLRWEQHRFAQRGDPAAAMKAARDVFRLQPSVELYLEIRGYARGLNIWESVRAELRTLLQTENRRHLLVESCLAEGDVDSAIDAVLRTPTADGRLEPATWLGDLAVRVADAAETTRPRDAIEIYLRGARRSIDLRGRANYQDACILLHNARRLYESMGEGKLWRQWVTQLREDNRRLHVLREELDRAGL